MRRPYACIAGSWRIPVLAWFPRLMHGTSAERSKWVLIGEGEGIHWPALDEDISVMGLLRGGPSMESRSSLQRWLDSRSRIAGRAIRRPARKTAQVPPAARSARRPRPGKHAY